MTSHSSVQCAPPEALGALLFTAPRLFPSSCIRLFVNGTLSGRGANWDGTMPPPGR
jgi:hypothetical protein